MSSPSNGSQSAKGAVDASINGPKRAVLYARVSTDEQARSGYSLAQQLEALREYAAQEGYEILEEGTDPGQSGASLERPGMDRARHLVAAGGVSVVLAQDRDRFAREPAYLYVLKTEFVERGTKLKALNDRGDDSPEGELMDGIFDQFAKFERAKTSERTRRGKLRKAREGKIIASMKPSYGFRYGEGQDSLTVHEPEMLVVEKIFRLAADGLGTSAIQGRLYRDGIPASMGGRSWQRTVIKRLVLNDIYKPHTYEETAELVSAEVATTLDPTKEYGIRWWNRQARKVRQVSELDGNGQRRYRKQITTTLRTKEEWVAIPVPAYLPRSLVHHARTMMAAHRCPERKHLARNWELRGLVRCRCGVLMRTHTSKSGEKLYHYYNCCCRSDYKRGTCRQKCLRAEAVEETVWRFVSSLLQDPEKIRTGMNALIEQERSTESRNVDKELLVWAKKVEECVHLRSAYQNQQAAGLMTLEELGANLTELDNMRKTAEQELVALKNRRERIEELEKDRDILLKSMVDRVPRALYDLSGEEKHKLYQILRIEVAPCEESYAVNGAFCTYEPIREYTDRP